MASEYNEIIEYPFVDVDMVKRYRNVFSSAEGQKVLAHILTDLRCFDEHAVCGETVLKNYASRILAILGGGGVSVDTANVLVRHLCAQSLENTNETHGWVFESI